MTTIGYSHYVLQGFDFADFPRGSLVLDLGSGDGTQMQKLQGRGCVPVGIEPNIEQVRKCRKGKLMVIQGIAEKLPLKRESLDGLVCKVVIPLTDESLVLKEIGRVLKPGAIAHLCYHGAGYYLRYLNPAISWKYWVYSIRTLINTWLYAATGKRLPSFLGDTLYQSSVRLQKYYLQSGLKLLSRSHSPSFLGFPVFTYHSIQKIGE